MKIELIKSLTHNFEDHSQTTENDIEFWFARDLQQLLGYAEWRNFQKVIIKAKTACEATGNNILDHFVEVNKMVQLGSGSEREIEDIKKLERRINTESKKLNKNPDKLNNDK